MNITSWSNFSSFPPGRIGVQPWDTLTIGFANCDHAAAALDGIDRPQKKNLAKLAGAAGFRTEWSFTCKKSI